MQTLQSPSPQNLSSFSNLSHQSHNLIRCRPNLKPTKKTLSPLTSSRIKSSPASVTAAPKRENDPKKRVVNTGMGLVSAFDNDVDTYYDRVLSGENGICLIDRFDAYKFPTRFPGLVRGFIALGYIEGKNDDGTAEKVTEEEVENHHPYAFHVCGPQNLPSPNWRDLINSSWKDANYRRTVIACFVQAVYLLELDRQEDKTEETGLAPEWWKPFKYKLSQTLIDERDGSIYGAVFEWDRTAALTDFILMRPSGAPRAVLALRGTLLTSQTIRRDIEDDLRYVAWESLEGSVRFNGALESLKTAVDRFGGCNVSIAGHSLGAGFSLQVGKALAKQCVFVETHLFNPPSISLVMSLRNIGEKAAFVWKILKSMLRLAGETQTNNEFIGNPPANGEGKVCAEIMKWVPHLYVNNSDYICCNYTIPVMKENNTSSNRISSGKENTNPALGQAAAKLFVTSKGRQKFLEAHGLEQWWANDLELQLALHNSMLINRQLKSLYSLPPPAPP